jgi:hypothetical protein
MVNLKKRFIKDACTCNISHFIFLGKSKQEMKFEMGIYTLYFLFSPFNFIFFIFFSFPFNYSKEGYYSANYEQLNSKHIISNLEIPN